jgi:hypothetical protein
LTALTFMQAARLMPRTAYCLRWARTAAQPLPLATGRLITSTAGRLLIRVADKAGALPTHAITTSAHALITAAQRPSLDAIDSTLSGVTVQPLGYFAAGVMPPAGDTARAIIWAGAIRSNHSG